MAADDLSRLRIDKKTVVARGKRKRRFVWLLLLLLLAGAAWYLYYKGLLTRAAPVQVTSIQNVYPSQAVSVLNASGYVVAQRKAAVSSKLTGRLIALFVEEGDTVKKGDVIARLENDDLQAARDTSKANLEAARASLTQLQAELKEARLDYERKGDLLERRAIGKADFDVAEARFRADQAGIVAQQALIRAAEASLRQAEVNLDYSFIRAPFDAVVLTKNADIGDIVTPIGAAANVQASVVTIADMNSLQVEVDVSESNIGKVRVDQPCEIQLDAMPDTRFRGKVHMIVPTADRSKASVLVKVAFIDRNAGILPEMSAKAAFLSRPLTTEELKPIKAVDAAAVVSRNGVQIVFVVQNERAVETKITTGKRLGDMVEVLSGGEIGDRVVVKPPDKMKDGLKVSIVEK